MELQTWPSLVITEEADRRASTGSFNVMVTTGPLTSNLAASTIQLIFLGLLAMTITSRSTDKTTVVVKHVLMMPFFQARNEAATSCPVLFVCLFFGLLRTL
jgi:hypothetical protein